MKEEIEYIEPIINVQNETEDAQIMTVKEFKDAKLVYNKMGGRPSVKLKIQGRELDCLLDTGARVNVMSKEIFQELKNIEIMVSNANLKCANESRLEVLGKARVETIIGKKKRMVTFIVVNKITPEVIGGMEMQKQFGIELQWIKKSTEKKENCYVCNIEGNFGRVITDEERFKKAVDVLKLNENAKLKDIIQRNRNVFMADAWDIGCTDIIKHKIVTKGEPIKIKPYRQPMNLEEKIDAAIKNLYENKIIKKCNSQWNTPLICVWKKEKKDIRLCLDFRRLNAITERQAFPMPNVEEMLDKLESAKYFSSIDLGNAYYQVELEEESKEKTAFSTKTGQYCFNRMPFGIAAAPGTFQELMIKVLNGMKNALVYLDDILIYTTNLEEHYLALNEVIQRIGRAGLKINPEKCHLLKKEVKFLGHIINKDGIKTDPAKIEAIKSFERPKCLKNLRSFLGICNYYRRFIKEYAKKSRALEEMCGKTNEKLIWSDNCNKAFEDMKNALTESPILAFPDFKKEFILDTDASFDTIGAVLSQRGSDGKERVVAYGSHAMNPHERGYCITRKELLAIYYFCNHFNHYLYGKRFTLRTDHKAITFMMTTKKPITAQFQTWINYLSSLDIQMEFRKGKDHANADMLSRNSCETCTQCLMAHKEAKTGKMKTRILNIMTEDASERWQEDSVEIDNIRKGIKKDHLKDLRVSGKVVQTKEGKIWIPSDRCQEMIRYTHELLSHAGIEKVTKYIKNNFEMHRMAEEVQNVIRNCLACQKIKVVTTKTKEINKTLSASEPFEKIYIDICGPLKETFRKEKYILAMIDHFSKYISLTAITRQDEQTIKKIIQNNWILKFGAPKEIHVDCGKNFESKEMKEFAAKLGVSLVFSSPYHHNTNGIIERQFRTIRDFINASLNERKPSNWAEILPEVEYTLNATVQKSLGVTPAEIVFGRKINRERWHYGNQVNRTELVKEQKEKNDSKDNNGEITIRRFNVGDEVLVKIENRSKNQERYEGPFKIMEKIHDRRYLLMDKDGRTIQRNVEKIKNFFNKGGCDI